VSGTVGSGCAKEPLQHTTINGTKIRLIAVRKESAFIIIDLYDHDSKLLRTLQLDFELTLNIVNGMKHCRAGKLSFGVVFQYATKNITKRSSFSNRWSMGLSFDENCYFSTNQMPHASKNLKGVQCQP
jgi:hypothetical protein